MTQELQVLQCYSCKIFEVDIVKKKPTWSCKLCGIKQSVKKIFHRGNGKECRLYVQELNLKRIRYESETSSKPSASCEFSITETRFESQCADKAVSKWCEFMENSEDLENTNFEHHGGVSRATKRNLDSLESEDKKPVSKWVQSISTNEDVVKDLNQENRIFVRKQAVNSNNLISVRNNVKERCREELSNLSNKIDGEAKKPKWEEFNKDEIRFDDIAVDKNLNNKISNVSNKKYQRDVVEIVEPEDDKSRKKLRKSNIFESATYGEVDSFLEI